ncbi:unnamed protein product [Leptidea sinapis]|nr:unnamed protein product [Leptidea sinapis]
MDLNGDNFVDRQELQKWILNSFVKLSHEEAEERMAETDENKDGIVTWVEYLRDSFGVDTEEEISPDDTGDTGMQMVRDEKIMWKAADADGDGSLDLREFEQDKEWVTSERAKFDEELDSNSDGILQHHDVFVGSEATDYGHELDRFDDEL